MHTGTKGKEMEIRIDRDGDIDSWKEVTHGNGPDLYLNLGICDAVRQIYRYGHQHMITLVSAGLRIDNVVFHGDYFDIAPEHIKDELVECAQMVADLDARMLALNEEIQHIGKMQLSDY